MGASVKVSIDRNWSQKGMRGMQAGMLELVTDVHNRAKILAPRDTGNLVNSGRIERIGSAILKVIFGSSRVPYARLRHFENRKNPQTIGYLAKAGESVSRGDMGKYFRGKV